MEIHKKNVNNRMTFTDILKQSGKIILTFKEGNIVITFFSKDNKQVGSTSKPIDETLKIADSKLNEFIDIEKLKTGHRYIFVPGNMIFCWLMCKEGDNIISKEKVLLMLIKKYENKIV